MLTSETKLSGWQSCVSGFSIGSTTWQPGASISNITREGVKTGGGGRIIDKSIGKGNFLQTFLYEKK